jgi:hypothetical protein
MSRRDCRLVAACLCAGLLVGCEEKDSTRDLPSWLPKRVARFDVRPAEVSDAQIGRREAVGIARQKMFVDSGAIGPKKPPLVYLVLATGRFLGEGPRVISPSTKVEVSEMKDRPVWLLIWRGTTVRGTADDSTDLVVFIDAVTGELLDNVVFGVGTLSSS